MGGAAACCQRSVYFGTALALPHRRTCMRDVRTVPDCQEPCSLHLGALRAAAGGGVARLNNTVYAPLGVCILPWASEWTAPGTKCGSLTWYALDVRAEEVPIIRPAATLRAQQTCPCSLPAACLAAGVA